MESLQPGERIMGVYNGNKKNDVIVGSNKDDFINGKEGDDHLSGGGGNDEIHGWYGNDQMYGGAGDDRMFGEFGSDYMEGGDGNDIVNGGDDVDTLLGGNGADLVYGGTGNDTISGGSGHDEISGDAGIDTLTGGADDDWFFFAYQSDSAGAGDVITDFQGGVDRLMGDTYPTAWDANASLGGRQLWEYVGSMPGSALANGNGRATVSSEGGYTVLRLYNNDGDDNADFVLNLQGIVSAQDLQITLWDGSGWNASAIIFPGG